MTKTFRDNCNTNIVKVNKLRAYSHDVQMQLKCTFSFLLYAHVRITFTIMVEFQKVMHAKIACGLQFWMQSSTQSALDSEC